MSGRRDAFWVNMAAGAALTIVLAGLSVIFNLGLLAIASVVGFLVLFGLFLWIAARFFHLRLAAVPPPDGRDRRKETRTESPTS